jgi:hypothetical protein
VSLCERRGVNPAGVYVVVGGAYPPAAIILTRDAIALFNDRVRVQREAALIATFGMGAEYAFPANDAMMSYLIERAVSDALPYAAELVQIAVAIVTGKAIGSGKDYSDSNGGSRVPAVPTKPRQPSPAGRAKVPSVVGSSM